LHRDKHQEASYTHGSPNLTKRPTRRAWRTCASFGLVALLTAVASAAGCGTTKLRTATEQLVVSDAVDRSVARIDFSPLAGEKVYFDTQYVVNVKGAGFVNAEYIVSSLRQQMVAANCLLQEKKEDADFVVEARVGALGTDDTEVNVGLPSNNALSAASSLVAGGPPLPPLPEISFGRRHDIMGASKVAVFAYNRETKEPVWQSGISTGRSVSKDAWVLGAGPFQQGSIYNGVRFAGSKLPFAPFTWLTSTQNISEAEAPYYNSRRFPHVPHREGKATVRVASHEEPALDDASNGETASEAPSTSDETKDSPTSHDEHVAPVEPKVLSSEATSGASPVQK